MRPAQRKILWVAALFLAAVAALDRIERFLPSTYHPMAMALGGTLIGAVFLGAAWLRGSWRAAAARRDVARTSETPVGVGDEPARPEGGAG